MKEKEELVANASRGGLLKPSDLVCVTCVHAWSLYHEKPASVRFFIVVVESSKCLFKPLHVYTLGK